jgi:hypothetical protein
VAVRARSKGSTAPVGPTRSHPYWPSSDRRVEHPGTLCPTVGRTYGDVLLQAPSDERRAHQAAPSAHTMPNCRPDERRATVARPSPDASQGCHPASIGERLFAHVVPRPTERFASWMTAGYRWERRRTLTPMNHWQPTAPGDTDRIKSCRQAVTGGGLVSLGVCMITASRSLCSNTAYRWVIRIEDHPAIWQSPRRLPPRLTEPDGKVMPPIVDTEPGDPRLATGSLGARSQRVAADLPGVGIRLAQLVQEHLPASGRPRCCQMAIKVWRTTNRMPTRRSLLSFMQGPSRRPACSMISVLPCVAAGSF